MNDLVPLKEASISLADLYAYSALKKHGVKSKEEFLRLDKQVKSILDIYLADEHCVRVIRKIKEELRVQRELAAAMPGYHKLDITEEQITISDVLFDGPKPATVSAADRSLIRKTFRMIAAIAHPDRGGSPEDFHEALTLKDAGDLRGLTFLYNRLCKERNLFWRQSEDGLADAAMSSSVFGRMLDSLTSSKIFRVARYHISGSKENAASQLHLILMDRLAQTTLQTQEFRSLLVKKIAEQRSSAQEVPQEQLDALEKSIPDYRKQVIPETDSLFGAKNEQ